MKTDTLDLYSEVLLTLNGPGETVERVHQAMQTVTTRLGIGAWRMVCQEQEVCVAEAHLIDAAAPFSTVLQLPLSVYGQRVGVLECLGAALTTESQMALMALADMCALVFSLHYQATHDIETGLYNRAFLNGYLDKRSEAGDCVVVSAIDVDGLKAANDTRGHAHGDYMLRKVATALQQCCRLKDFAVRSGGDEFLLILREVPERKVEWLQRALASRLQEVLKHLVPISFSFGIVGGGAEQLRALLDLADEQMYAHKRQSKLTLCTPPQVSLVSTYSMVYC